MKTTLAVLFAVVGVMASDTSCPVSSPCAAASACTWYQHQKAQRSQYDRGSRDYKKITETLKKSICNKAEKKVCCSICPSSAPCMDSSSCPWYKNNLQMRKQHQRNSPEYRNISRTLKEAICNKEERKVCCQNKLETDPRVTTVTSSPTENSPPTETSRPTEATSSTEETGLDPTSPRWLPSAAKSECGLEDLDFIIGGNVTRLGEYPWASLLGRTSRAGGRIEWYCGGTLINHWYVVTAAHCAEEALVKVRLGEWKVVDPFKPDFIKGEICKRSQKKRCKGCKLVNCKVDCGPNQICGPPLQDIPVDKIIRHPAYHILRSSGIAINDIALIKLKRPAQFNSLVQPVCLPTDRCAAAEDLRLDNCNLEELEGRAGVAVGWGTTYKESDANVSIVASHIQYKVEVPYVSNERCGQIYEEVFNQDVSGDIGNEEYLCAGGEYGKDTCKGDSGGGLVMKARGPQWLMAVVATGTKRCGVGLPAIFTRIDRYMDWIKRAIAQ